MESIFPLMSGESLKKCFYFVLTYVYIQVQVCYPFPSEDQDVVILVFISFTLNFSGIKYFWLT